MKKVLLISLVLFGLAMFQSCDDSENDPGNYYAELAEIIPIDDESFYFITDSGLKLFPSSSYIPWYYPSDTTRVIVYYSVVGPSESIMYDYYITLNDLSEVLTKQIVFQTMENQDSLGNDFIYLHDAWVRGKYLNIDFNYYGGYMRHMVNLVAYEDSLNKIPLTLEFRHNAYNDPAEAFLSALVCFDLSQVIPQDKDSIQIKVLFQERNYTNSYDFWYKP